MCNEGELLEKFNIQLAPIPMPELVAEVRACCGIPESAETVRYIRETMEVLVDDDALETIAALKVAVRRLAGRYGCRAVALQCWNALQNELGIMPCAANALLNDEGLPVVCETDIHGAVTALPSGGGGTGWDAPFFADWTIRHPDNENGELLQHCGPWPVSVARKGRSSGIRLLFSPGCRGGGGEAREISPVAF